MTQFLEKTLDAGGARLPLRSVGTGKPVVYLHAGGSLPETVTALAERVQVLGVDVSGLGRGEGGARALATALAARGIDGFDVMANGSAAGQALWLALVAGTVPAIVLVAPTLLDANGSCFDPALLAQLAGLKSHVLALFGTRDTTAPPTHGRLYRKAIPNCHLVFVYDAGHDIQAERPAAAAAVIRDFLERREQFVVSTQSGKIYP
jgi:pimeloyl-ACP methyl ester carboxylesterase